MGLFDKKFCDFCGGKIGLLGNRKLEDANMCKDCASKLSPWFSERRHSTKADIDQQLAYREQNKQAVASFSATQTLGRHTKLLIDENARKFMVTSASDIYSANPDVLDYSQALGCELDVKENRNEIRRTDSSGKSVSYNPPRYEYSYDFHVTIRVNNPYFDEMKFSLSNGSIKVGEQPMNPGMGGSWSVSRSGIGLGANKINEYYECVDVGNQIKAAVDAMRMGGNVSMAIAGGGMQPGMMPQGGMAPGMGAPAGMAAAGMGIVQGFNQGMQPGMQQGYGQNMGQAMQQGMPQQGFGQGMQPGMQQGYGQNMGQPMQQGMPQQGYGQGMAQGMQQGMQQGYGNMGQPMQGMQQGGMAPGMGAPAGMAAAGMGMQGMPQQGYGQNMQGMQGGMNMAQGMGQGMPQAQGGMGAPGMQVICPACQATTTIGADGCCEFCGNRIL
ncbi:MAG: DUF4428 domain-containing protein [Clostridiales bacterium]|nr:DUF4428 domain-containing protein [Clostridiales bacterium]